MLAALKITRFYTRFIKPSSAVRKFSDNNRSKDSSHDSSDNARQEDHKENLVQNALAVRGSFEAVKDKNRQTYLQMIRIFENKESVHKRGHVEFIYTALRNMESFGVQHDLDVYKALVDVMPKGKFIPTNIFQAEFMHYPKQQQCIIDLLEQMEDNGVMPDGEMENILLNIFGRKGHPVRKFWRMMYWMPKFKNLSPWPIPNPPPNDILELAKLAVDRMCSVDLKSITKVYETDTIKDAIDHTWIVSGQSDEQIRLLTKYPQNLSVYIEGPFLIWLRNKCIQYFILRGDPLPSDDKNEREMEEDPDDVSSLNIPKFGQSFTKNKIALKRSVHELDEGTIFALCATGSSTKDSLLSWIRCLEHDGNPVLATTPVLFKFRSLPNTKDLMIIKNSSSTIDATTN